MPERTTATASSGGRRPNGHRDEAREIGPLDGAASHDDMNNVRCVMALLSTDLQKIWTDEEGKTGDDDAPVCVECDYRQA
jgi:hypothetical protein